MFDKGFFGGLFDFNGDGKLDGFERAADHLAFMNMVSESEKTESKESGTSFGSSGFDDEEDEIVNELEAAGLDFDELEYMDDDERYEVLEDAGLDPDDFDF